MCVYIYTHYAYVYIYTYAYVYIPRSASGDVMISKINWQTYTSEFGSHWVPHSFGFVPHLSRKLCKLLHMYIYIYVCVCVCTYTYMCALNFKSMT